MGLFSKSPPSNADHAEAMRERGSGSAKAAAVAKAVGAEKVSNAMRRQAATSNVVARYYESDRCQFGHRNCTADDH